MAIATSFSDFVAAAAARSRGRLGAAAFTFRSWQREQGLPQNPVHALAKPAMAIYGSGSDDGVMRFDGCNSCRWAARGVARRRGCGRCWRTARGRCGSAWPAAADLLEGGAVHHLRPTEGLPRTRSRPWRRTAQGRLWVGTRAAWRSGRTAGSTAWPAAETQRPGRYRAV